MTAALELRPERAEDSGAIHAVHDAAFKLSSGEADLVDALRAAGDLVEELSLVAVREGEVVGHVAISRAGLDDDVVVLVLAPIGVLPSHQHDGVGSALTRAVLERAGETEYPLVVVLGHATYYPRFGFEPAEPLGVRAPFPVQPESWMAYRLPGYRPEARGTVRYADAFSA